MKPPLLRKKTNPSAGLNPQMVTDQNPIHILLADDDEDDRLLFQEVLNEFSPGVVLSTVIDGEKLMDALATTPTLPPPHIIFLDINMPRKNGIECLAEIRSNTKFDNVPVFMFSTSANKKDIDMTYEGGANLYIPKSVFFSDQKESIRKIFSVHWKEYLAKTPKERFVLNGDGHKEKELW